MAPVLTALHFLTHVGQSWIVANLGPGSAKDRWLVVLAGVLLDLDGVGILWSQSAYAAMHLWNVAIPLGKSHPHSVEPRDGNDKDLACDRQTTNSPLR